MNLEDLVIENSGQKFQANDFRQLRQPGVYAFLRDGIPLYIGFGKCLLQACARTNSHRKRSEALELCDEVRLFPCKSVADAIELERLLIEHIRPTHNTNLKARGIGKLLGIH